MRLGLFALPAIAAGLFSLPASAQSLPTCANIALVAPANGSHFLGSRPIMFRWSGEPVGTVGRELHLAALDGTESVTPLDGRFSDTVNVKMAGDRAWAVVFLDAGGKPLCTTPIGLLVAGSGGGSASRGTEAGVPGNSSAAVGPAPRLVVGFTRDGRLVIMQENSPYTGQYSKLVPAGDYDLTLEDLMGATGVEFHGSNLADNITGSPGSDLIYLYGGDDTAEGGAGDDTLVGGVGDDTIGDNAPGDSDALYGGPDNDTLDIDDGDPNDRAFGGSGSDTIYADDFIGSTSSNGPDEP